MVGRDAETGDEELEQQDEDEDEEDEDEDEDEQEEEEQEGDNDNKDDDDIEYECDYDCGFLGTCEQVSAHEGTCQKRTQTDRQTDEETEEEKSNATLEGKNKAIREVTKDLNQEPEDAKAADDVEPSEAGGNDNTSQTKDEKVGTTMFNFSDGARKPRAKKPDMTSEKSETDRRMKVHFWKFFRMNVFCSNCVLRLHYLILYLYLCMLSPKR